MAQWARQYTGRTHESKVRDLEEALMTSIRALRAADEEHFSEKEKSVVQLCERLLSARIKAIKPGSQSYPKRDLSRMIRKRPKILSDARKN